MVRFNSFFILGNLTICECTELTPNSDVLKILYNGYGITHRPRDRWIIDFGVSIPEEQSCLYELPYQYLVTHVKPNRMKLKATSTRLNCAHNWWIHERPRPELRAAIHSLKRFIVTPKVSKYRIFVWLSKNIIPECSLFTIARDDDTTFGILQSRFHEIWSLKFCS